MRYERHNDCVSGDIRGINFDEQFYEIPIILD